MLDLRRYCGRHSTALAACAAILAVVLAAVAGGGILVARGLQDLHAAQRANASVASSASQQHLQLLGFLAQHHPDPKCTPESLGKLGEIMFSARFTKDIGLLDAKGRLYCTVGLGPLPSPLVMPETPYRHKLGGRLWFNWAPPHQQGRYRSVASEHRDYLTLIDPGAVDDVLQKAGVVWQGFVANPAQVHPDFAPEWLVAIEPLRAQADGRWHFDWHGRVFLTVQRVPETLVSIGDAVTPQALLGQQLDLLILLGTMLLVLGASVFNLIRPRLQALGRLGKRLPLLLNERNLLCYYQPIVELASGRPIGCEVLMRIQDEGRLLMPDVIIPAVQAEGLMLDLDAAVLRCALNEFEVVAKHMQGFELGFNLFPGNISHAFISSLTASHREWLKEQQVQVNIEVTEYHFSESIIPELRQLEAEGFSISVDDFGTGYSNLNTVKKVAPHTLKIDKSFVYEMEDASIRSSLIPEIVGIAHAVSANVLAEGIENAEQASRLLEMGVTFGQGYYFGRPMQLGEFVKYVRDWQRSNQ